MSKAFNNGAQDEALLARMKIHNVLGAKLINLFSNSQLLVSEVKEEYKVRNAVKIAHMAKVKEKSIICKKPEIKHVPCS